MLEKAFFPESTPIYQTQSVTRVYRYEPYTHRVGTQSLKTIEPNAKKDDNDKIGIFVFVIEQNSNCLKN